MNTKENLKKYLIEHKDDKWFSKYYGAYFLPIFIQATFAVNRAVVQSSIAMPHGLLFQEWMGPRQFDWQWNVQEMQECRDSIFEALEKDLEWGNNFYQHYRLQWQIFDKAAKKEEGVDYKKASTETIVENLLELIEAASKQGYAYIIDSFLVSGEDWFKTRATKYAKHDLKESDVEILRLPTKRTFVNEAHLALLEAACAVKKGEDITNTLTDIAQKYYWIENNYLQGKPKMEDDFNKEIITIENPLEDFKIESERLKNNLQRRENLLSQLNASDLLRAFIQLTDDFTFIQDMRKQAVLRLNYFILNYMQEIAERLAYDKNLVFLLTHYELPEFIRAPETFTEQLQERRKGFLVIYENEDYAICTRSELKDIDLSNFHPDFSEIHEAKGTPASPGTVRGVVRNVLGGEQFKNFKPGEILVTNQTTPDFVPLMKKALAIVAEQGGITSHAAIVSRELGIPAIVGVEKAMQIFKDGDEVEVDAVKGVVKKI